MARLVSPTAVEERKEHVGKSLPEVPGQKDKQIWVWTEQSISQAIIPPSHTVPGHLRLHTSVLLSPWHLGLKIARLVLLWLSFVSDPISMQS